MSKNQILYNVTKEFQKLKKLSFDAVEQINNEQFFEIIQEGNSIAILVKHLSGNMKSRWTDFLNSDGEKPNRNRDTEFEIYENDSRERVLDNYEKSWTILFDTLNKLIDVDFAKTVYIRKEPHTVHQAILRQLTHYSYHIGQIVLLAKQIKKEEWKTLSVAKGKSKEFNANPKSYFDK